MQCPKCNAQLHEGAEFCPICGAAVHKAVQNKNTNRLLAVIIALVGVLIFIVSMMIAIKAFDKSTGFSGGGGGGSVSVHSTTQPGATATPVPTSTPIPTATPMPPRDDLYNPAYTYKRMDAIHNTTLVSDEKYIELKNVIIDFNQRCEAYMNYGDTAIFKYLKSGTTAYDQQTKYKEKHPTLYQTYTEINVVNARHSGSIYYVWVTEKMIVTENNETKNTTDYWVYKIEQMNGEYYILDYTADPARS